jgi:hypothetical protein
MGVEVLSGATVGPGPPAASTRVLLSLRICAVCEQAVELLGTR